MQCDSSCPVSTTKIQTDSSRVPGTRKIGTRTYKRVTIEVNMQVDVTAQPAKIRAIDMVNVMRLGRWERSGDFNFQ
jgi:hypothetical protein